MFCIVKGLESLGIGKVIDDSEEMYKVEYFDSPSQTKRDVRKVKKSLISIKKLGSNTRIYYQDYSTKQWRVGRVLEDMDGGVKIRFTNKVDKFFYYENLYVRIKKQITDPVDYLANVITETPQYAEARSGFLASYISQRGVAWGISALLSSVIELESHQINVIRRILNDPSQRYLLADEVGLGKTIEAGVIIRQAVLDNPRHHSVIILVPRSLMQQWRQELIIRFGLYDFIGISVHIIAHDSIEEIDKHLMGATLLVIDEAHHVASNINAQSRVLYDIISAYSPSIERLILLSATPILRNELGFLRMLHLLDPVVYNLEDEEAFRSKINHRQILAETVASLIPQNALYLDSILDSLLQILPDDGRLFELVSILKLQLIGMPDEDDQELIESIRMLRAHLSETYRLHRRILRNRRKQVTGLTPNRNGARLLFVNQTQMEQVESLLEAWRINATLMSDSKESDELLLQMCDFYWNVVAALLNNPSDIKLLCEERCKSIEKVTESSFDGEITLLKELSDMFDPQQWIQDRIDCLKQELKILLIGKAKIIIFCSQEIIADSVFLDLCLAFPSIIVRHVVIEGDDEFDNDDAAWFKFNLIDTIRIIVCDQRAEEGINLQGGTKIMIHFDLPNEPNRIEQRLGRVDRYGSGDAIQSIVMIDDGSNYQLNWYLILNEALEVFGRSISSLQYLIEDRMQQLKVTLYSRGVEAIEDLRKNLSGVSGDVSRELKLIDQQDSMDEMMPLSDSDLDAISDVDADWKDIRYSTLYWVCDTLLFGQIADSKTVSTQPELETPIRFQYRVPGNGGVATLIPLSGFMDDFLGGLDCEDPRSTASQPLSYPHLSRRQSAVKRGTRLIRYGDDFIEALKSFSDHDDRGRSYAMWRQIMFDFPSTTNNMYFRFDFLIETALEHAKTVLEELPSTHTDTATSAISRRGDALFPPIIVQVWIDEEGDEVDLDFVEKYLTSPYDKNGENGAYVDTNLSSERFLSLMAVEVDIFTNWSERCFRMRNRANDIVLSRSELAEAKILALNNANIEDEVRVAQLTTRIRMLEGIEAELERKQLVLEHKINEALYQGIENPSVKVDVTGVVILSAKPFSNCLQQL
jgi:ATP-dependent helicase HepA